MQKLVQMFGRPDELVVVMLLSQTVDGKKIWTKTRPSSSSSTC